MGVGVSETLWLLRETVSRFRVCHGVVPMCSAQPFVEAHVPTSLTDFLPFVEEDSFETARSHADELESMVAKTRAATSKS